VRRWLIALLVIVPIAAALGWLAWFSPWLAVSQVQVNVSTATEVAGLLTADEVRAVAAVEPGVPLLRVPTAEIESRVAALPQVASVTVSRSWPDTVVIDITRRVPVALVATGSGYDVVDASGGVIRSVSSIEAGAPVVRATGEGLAAAISVASELPEPIARKVVTVEASTRNDVRLILRNGAEVMWGSAEDGAFKAEVLQTLFQVDARWYDVSAPAVPATSDTPRRSSN
jgi:cell division protein FtsQ